MSSNQRIRVLRQTTRVLTLALPLALWACGPPAPEAPATPADSSSGSAAPPSPSPLPGADPLAYRGAAVAGQVCAQCHDIGAGAPPAISIPGATAFSEVARRPETTPESLAAWLRASHPSMPNYIFGEAQTADIVAYIMSLRTGQ
jgi:mono/diheme cytochrome c family protein